MLSLFKKIVLVTTVLSSSILFANPPPTQKGLAIIWEIYSDKNASKPRNYKELAKVLEDKTGESLNDYFTNIELFKKLPRDVRVLFFDTLFPREKAKILKPLILDAVKKAVAAGESFKNITQITNYLIEQNIWVNFPLVRKYLTDADFFDQFPPEVLENVSTPHERFVRLAQRTNRILLNLNSALVTKKRLREELGVSPVFFKRLLTNPTYCQTLSRHSCQCLEIDLLKEK